MASNCEDCFDRAVTIPVGPAGPTGATGAQGPVGNNGTDGDDGIVSLVNLFGGTPSSSSNFTNLITGIIPANLLTKVGDRLLIEFDVVGTVTTNTPLYTFKLNLGGIDIPGLYAASGNSVNNRNGASVTVEVIVANLSPFTLRVHVKKVESSAVFPDSLNPSNILMVSTTSNVLNYSLHNPANNIVNLIDPTVNNTLIVQGKNDTGNVADLFNSMRLSVKLIKQI
jgi:hypothetical protein